MDAALRFVEALGGQVGCGINFSHRPGWGPCAPEQGFGTQPLNPHLYLPRWRPSPHLHPERDVFLSAWDASGGRPARGDTLLTQADTECQSLPLLLKALSPVPLARAAGILNANSPFWARSPLSAPPLLQSGV